MARIFEFEAFNLQAVALEDSNMSGYVTSEFMFDSEGGDPADQMDLSMSRGGGGGGGGGGAGGLLCF